LISKFSGGQSSSDVHGGLLPVHPENFELFAYVAKADLAASTKPCAVLKSEPKCLSFRNRPNHGYLLHWTLRDLSSLNPISSDGLTRF
jgi:hypothetical protein